MTRGIVAVVVVDDDDEEEEEGDDDDDDDDDKEDWDRWWLWTRDAARAESAMELCARCPILNDDGVAGPGCWSGRLMEERA